MYALKDPKAMNLGMQRAQEPGAATADEHDAPHHGHERHLDGRHEWLQPHDNRCGYGYGNGHGHGHEPHFNLAND